MMDNAASLAQDTNAEENSAKQEALAMQKAAQDIADAFQADKEQNESPFVPEIVAPSQETVLQEEIVSLKDQLLRAVAETENVRRRGQRDLDEGRKYAVTGFARDLSSVIENLYRAIGSITPELRGSNEAIENLAQGLDMTLREMTSTLERHGVKRIWPQGEIFNHNHHQAVAQIDDNEHPAGTILQVLQAGYIIHDRLLQPAMVCVSRPSAGHVDTQA